MRILFDNDTGIDDALALVYLLSKPEVDLAAITCSAGNVSADQVARNNLALLQLCGRPEVEVAAGASDPLSIPLVTTPETHGEQGLGYATLPAASAPVSQRSAVDLWIEEVRRAPGELTALLTAPLTNFALALRRDAELPRLLKRTVIMGGCYFYQGNTTPTAEWNTHVDPHAAAEVFAAFEGLPEEQLPIVCALETTERIELTSAHLARLAQEAGSAGEELLRPEDPPGTPSTAANPLIRVLSDALRFYFEFHRQYDQGYIAHVHDLFAAAVAAGTVDYRVRPATVHVETAPGPLVGTTVADYRGLWGRKPNARIVAWNDPPAVFDEVIGSIAALARRLESGTG
ncbi:inosine/uridine-preferring nucleoside hydrolase [Arthrobacter crystallopoietes BAB-32]|uniref:Inosine/uridine-preferring nucleoside hydrolase n=1 Tax=Arthrobacter crystallopoietes BAB-32 TaxID=1246476 RepID=N1UP56_9MICC|nr:nucleoside hydrolase [Arthrobacter crystallopoietes]EMY32201.1 inosine/uridine-preferring nucleoside hydrolase [Arthrobacter crystallopoietes BAB-32]